MRSLFSKMPAVLEPMKFACSEILADAHRVKPDWQNLFSAPGATRLDSDRGCGLLWHLTLERLRGRSYLRATILGFLPPDRSPD